MTKLPSNATVAQLLYDDGDPKRRAQLEAYRVKYEAAHGPTDLTRRYTSLWPVEHQDWLMEHHPKLYFDGLPPFVQGYFLENMQVYAQRGNLDIWPKEFIRYFMEKKREMGEGGRGPSC